MSIFACMDILTVKQGFFSWFSPCHTVCMFSANGELVPTQRLSNFILICRAGASGSHKFIFCICSLSVCYKAKTKVRVSTSVWDGEEWPAVLWYKFATRGRYSVYLTKSPSIKYFVPGVGRLPVQGWPWHVCGPLSKVLIAPILKR